MAPRQHSNAAWPHKASRTVVRKDSAVDEEELQKLRQAQYKQFRDALSPFWAWRQKYR